MSMNCIWRKYYEMEEEKLIIKEGGLEIRHLEDSDKQILVKWLSDPVVLQYYEGRDNPHDLERVNARFFNREDDTTRCIAEYDGKPIAYIQFYLVDDESKGVYGYDEVQDSIYGTDQFIGEVDYWNKGIGTLLVNLMKKSLIEKKEASRIVMDPQADNMRAIACYEKCGFKKVKLLPQSELHEGEWRDCWLMEYVVSTIDIQKATEKF